MFNTSRKDVLGENECIRDLTFIATDSINNFLIRNTDIKNLYIIYASFLMDLMILGYISLFIFYWKTYRLMIAYIIFFGIRTFVQVITTFA